MQADCDNKKTKDAHWRDKEDLRLEKEEERRDRDDAHNEEEHLYGQWECAMETNESLKQDHPIRHHRFA